MSEIDPDVRENQLAPWHVFRFQVDFEMDPIPPPPDRSSSPTPSTGSTTPVPLCSGAFSECTGLEATMEVKVIKEGGRNYGVIQRSGPVSFATVILKRGMTTTRDLYNWFELVGNGAYAYRLAATVTMFDPSGKGVLSWKLEKAIPVKFKAAELNAKSTEVGVEELQLAHEGLVMLSTPKVGHL
jgi:phage tail-like protein